MKAIETIYAGYRFRSRLEARWAVFFDALGLKWTYEIEGFELSDGTRYLPDFKITSSQDIVWWYEVKPKNVTSDQKFDQFVRDLRLKHDHWFDECHEFGLCSEDSWKRIGEATLLNGDPVEFFEDRKNFICPRCGGIQTSPYTYRDFQCGPCDSDTPCGGGWPDERGDIVPCAPHKGILLINENNLPRYLTKINTAAQKARSARFEFGR